LIEYFYSVDENDNILGKARREKCHGSNAIIHRSVYIFVLNHHGEIFIQKRSELKDLYGGYYTGSATGHVDFCEDYDDAAKRELMEELGIDAPLDFIGRFKSFSEIEREISALYLCHYSGPMKLNYDEVSKGFFMSPDEIKKELDYGKKKFAHGFKVAFKKFLKHMDLSIH